MPHRSPLSVPPARDRLFDSLARWPVRPDEALKRSRRGWRALLALASITVVLGGVLGGVLITHLRTVAVAARAADQQMADVHYLISESDRLAWQLVAQGSTDSALTLVAQGSTDSALTQTLQSDAKRISADLANLEQAHAGSVDLARVPQWVPIFERQLAEAQRLIGAGRLTAAEAAVRDQVHPTGQLIQQAVGRLGPRFSERANQANTRMYTGTMVALGVSAVLAILLAAAFAAGRRRVLAAERSALQRSERRFRALVHKASEVVVLTDAERRITYSTDAVLGLVGRSPDALVGRRFEELLPVDERPSVLQLFDRTLRTAPAGTPTQWTIARPDGTTSLVEAQSANLLDDPDVAGVVLTIRDVTGRREMEAQLRHQALHDPLTGLANRTLFEDRVSQALQRFRRSDHSISVLYLDIDGFKEINDSLGHGAGDQLLRTVAGRIDSCLRGSDTAARLGGDEFACLVEDFEDPDQAFTVARRLGAALAPTILVEDRPITVRASIGIAQGTKPLISAGQLIHSADLAMYQAKAKGRGEIAVFHEDLLIAARSRLSLREDLRYAIERNELTLAYQPLVRLESPRVVGIEALLRWQHGKDGLIPPDRFIPIAEETGLIVTIGRWVLDRALTDLAQWSTTAPELAVNVNVAPRELAEDDYVQTVAATLARHGIEPSRLTLELTESEFLDDGETSQRLQALAQLGVQLAIDDFGTGQSSLARLQRLPVTQVKMDRSFLAAIDESTQSATLVRSMIELGQDLGLEMVAEGIERDSQYDMLRQSPCALGQGFFFGRPQPADVIAGLLAQPDSLPGWRPAAALAD